MYRYTGIQVYKSFSSGNGSTRMVPVPKAQSKKLGVQQERNSGIQKQPPFAGANACTVPILSQINYGRICCSGELSSCHPHVGMCDMYRVLERPPAGCGLKSSHSVSRHQSAQPTGRTRRKLGNNVQTSRGLAARRPKARSGKCKDL